MTRNKEFFFCYDANLSYHLKFEKGFDYILKAINPNSKKMFWLYWKSPELNNAITKFFESSEKRN